MGGISPDQLYFILKDEHFSDYKISRLNKQIKWFHIAPLLLLLENENPTISRNARKLLAEIGKSPSIIISAANRDKSVYEYLFDTLALKYAEFGCIIPFYLLIDILFNRVLEGDEEALGLLVNILKNKYLNYLYKEYFVDILGLIDDERAVDPFTLLEDHKLRIAA